MINLRGFLKNLALGIPAMFAANKIAAPKGDAFSVEVKNWNGEVIRQVYRGLDGELWLAEAGKNFIRVKRLA